LPYLIVIIVNKKYNSNPYFCINLALCPNIGGFAMKKKLTFAALLLYAFLLSPLTASAENMISPVHEPVTMILLGVGLISLALSGRHLFKK
jgi:hypothetical protein